MRKVKKLTFFSPIAAKVLPLWIVQFDFLRFVSSLGFLFLPFFNQFRPPSWQAN
jgi:hypothetical protein